MTRCGPASPFMVLSVNSPLTNLHHAALLVRVQSAAALKVMATSLPALRVLSCNAGNSILPPPGAFSSSSSEHPANDATDIMANAAAQLMPFKFNAFITVNFKVLIKIGIDNFCFLGFSGCPKPACFQMSISLLFQFLGFRVANPFDGIDIGAYDAVFRSVFIVNA